MPPKGSKKAQADEKVPATPEKPKAKVKVEATPSTPQSKSKADSKETPAKARATPKKTKPDVAVDFKPIVTESTDDAHPPITVTAESENGQALQKRGKTSFIQLLKLEGANSFSVPKTIMLTEGPYAGMQAILIRPARPFEFQKLPEEVRNRVYRYYFAPKGVVGENIVIDGKRPVNKEVFAKTYAEGSKNRVGLLTVNKEFGKEATDIFYAETLKFDSTQTLIDFISQVPTAVRLRLTSISVKSYSKSSARNCMHFLAEAKNISRLRFGAGVFGEGDPIKACKAFHGDAYKFLEAIGSHKGRKDAGVDVLEFAKGSLVTKEKKPWPDSMVEEFKTKLRAKLNGGSL